jgi:hypothetical protein
MRTPITLQGEAAKNAITSKEFYAYPMADVYNELSTKSGIDFSAAILLMKHLPIFLDGDDHKDKRKRMAQVYADTRSRQEQNISSCIDQIIFEISVYNGEYDIIEGLANPIWRALQDAICDLDRIYIEPELVREIPRLFDPNLSLRRRKLINDKISDHLSNISSFEQPEFFDRIALLVLGVRPLVNSLALSLYKIAELQKHVKLNEIEFPKSFSHSALTFVDRIARKSVEIHGQCYDEGTRFRCVTVDETYLDIENQKNMFGLGAHLCLGRPISMYIWKQLTASLGTLSKMIKPMELQYAQNEPFIVVSKAKIEILD